MERQQKKAQGKKEEAPKETLKHNKNVCHCRRTVERTEQSDSGYRIQQSGYGIYSIVYSIRHTDSVDGEWWEGGLSAVSACISIRI